MGYHLDKERWLRAPTPQPVTFIVCEKHIVAHKDPVPDDVDDLGGDDLVVEGLKNLDGGIKGLSVKLDVVPGVFKDPLAHVRGGDALF